MPEDKATSSTTPKQSSPKVKPDTPSEDSTSDEDEIQEVKPPPLRESLRSRRSRERVSWKMSGGTLEKVVIKQEPDAEEASKDPARSPRAKRAKHSQDEKEEVKVKGKGKGKKSNEVPKAVGKSRRKVCENKDIEDQRNQTSAILEGAESTEVTNGEENEHMEQVNEKIGVDEQMDRTEKAVLVEDNATTSESAGETEKLSQAEMEAQASKEEADGMILEIPMDMLFNEMPAKEESESDNRDVTDVESQDTALQATGDLSSEVPVVNPTKSKRGRKAKGTKAPAAGTDGKSEVPKGKSKKRFPRPQEQCNMCGNTYLVDNMERHKRYLCKSNPDRVPLHRCNLCLYATEDTEDLEKHKNIHPPDFKPKFGKKCVCEVCGGEFETMKAKLHHEWKVHNYFGMRVSYNCEFCGKRYPTKWQYDEHVGYHMGKCWPGMKSKNVNNCA